MAHILAVDDSEPIRKMLRMVLANSGHTLELAADGIEALDIFSRNSFNLVVTDINMPRMTGLELIRQIRYLNAEIPILALTTESEQRIREQGKIAGVDGWIVKPFRPAQFLDIVKQISG
jgi:two-component system chemotaxis response regulator CheY